VDASTAVDTMETGSEEEEEGGDILSAALDHRFYSTSGSDSGVVCDSRSLVIIQYSLY